MVHHEWIVVETKTYKFVIVLAVVHCSPKVLLFDGSCGEEE